MGKLAVALIGWALKRSLTSEEKNKIVIHILRATQAIPLHAIVDVNDDGELTISGSTLDIERAVQLRESANLALNNKALNLIREQVVYETFVGSAIKSQKPEDLLFYRAALWWGEQVDRHLKTLAQRQQELSL